MENNNVRRSTAAYSFDRNDLVASPLITSIAQEINAATTLNPVPSSQVKVVVDCSDCVSGIATTTMSSIMTELVEKDFDAWMRLPESIRRLMVASPADFTLINDGHNLPNVVYCSVEFAFDGGVWVVAGIQ